MVVGPVLVLAPVPVPVLELELVLVPELVPAPVPELELLQLQQPLLPPTVVVAAAAVVQLPHVLLVFVGNYDATYHHPVPVLLSSVRQQFAALHHRYPNQNNDNLRALSPAYVSCSDQYDL